MKIRSVRLSELDDETRTSLVSRSAVPDASIRSEAGRIVESIRTDGDKALRSAAAGFGGGSRRVEETEIVAAWKACPADLRIALEHAASAIRAVHQAQLPTDQSLEPHPGVRVRRRWSPLRRAGGYVPGGLAAYPSSLLMIAIPAAVAGVTSIAIATPADPHDRVPMSLLAAAHLCGVHEVYAMGGAQAIGALAYGTETIERVDKIVGPGNAWVTAAKLAVFGDCDIDLPAGPSESLLLVDDAADLRVVAADMACQAEHGPDSPVVLVTNSERIADTIEGVLASLLTGLARRDILESSLGNHGLILLVDNWDEGIEFANAYAPEHLSILTEDATALADRITGAGSVFVGHWSPESAGDYATGANHVLPTGGLARSSGPLATTDFGSWRQEQELSRDGLQALLPTITSLAGTEGLDAHRLAATIRFEDPPSTGVVHVPIS
ncbi:MAG: histidinol dehydrogenase [Acidimicrobiia bacterium]|nr:histidinol dehydrogenase [Acidimicrobiia bacterium]